MTAVVSSPYEYSSTRLSGAVKLALVVANQLHCCVTFFIQLFWHFAHICIPLGKNHFKFFFSFSLLRWSRWALSCHSWCDIQVINDLGPLWLGSQGSSSLSDRKENPDPQQGNGKCATLFPLGQNVSSVIFKRRGEISTHQKCMRLERAACCH